jgi:hypothetical protein
VVGRWFSPGTPIFSTNKSDYHDIIEILLKVALNIIALIHTVLEHIPELRLQHGVRYICFHKVTKRLLSLRSMLGLCCRRGRGLMIVGFTTIYLQSVPITTNAVSSYDAHARCSL